MSIFGKSFEPFIKEQIKKRQEVYGKSSRNMNDLKYINGKKPWIKMASSVDVLDESRTLPNLFPNDTRVDIDPQFIGPIQFKPRIQLGVYTPDMAEKYALFGGILNSNGTVKGGLGDGGVYSLKTPLGTPHLTGRKPMPGITSINVETIGAYGSLRKATVNFVCWDIKQLEELEPLYMRPGYQVLLEWGWTPYINNKGNLISTINSYVDKIENGKKAFYTSTNKTSDEINKELFTKAKLSDGNYNGFFGVVENFSWVNRDDGGYDCKTTLLSIGEILESLKVNFIPNRVPVNIKGKFEGLIINKNLPSKDITETDVGNIGKAYFKYNILYGLMYELRKTIEKRHFSPDLTTNFINGKIKLIDREYEDDLVEYAYNTQNFSDVIPELNTSLTDQSKNIYITFKSLLNIFNHHVLPKDLNNKNMVSFSTKERGYLDEYINGGKKIEELECISDPLQISVDPSICIVKNPTWTKDSSFQGIEGFIPSSLNYLNSLDKTYINKISQNGIISNIYVNLRYLENMFLTTKTDQSGDVLLYDMVKEILVDIQSSMGYINNFDIYLDPIEGNVARVIDKSFTSQSKEKKDVTILEVNKRNSFVKNYRLSSQIFPEQSSIIAISAQALPNEHSSKTLMSFNGNIINRFSKNILFSSPNTNQNSNFGMTESLIELNKFFEEILSTFKSLANNDNPTYIKGETQNPIIIKNGEKSNLTFSDYRNVLKEFLNIKRNINHNEDGKNFADIIPTKLTLEMDGISGFVIGNLFNISPEFIPEFYKVNNNNIQSNYIVTSYSDEINESEWKTSIGGQTILLNNEIYKSNKINNLNPTDYK
jgi:hypothetical protein